jgi:hypothetical protein
MSPRSSSSGKKAKGPAAAPDVYVALLFVAVASLVIGICLMYGELAVYEWKMP